MGNAKEERSGAADDVANPPEIIGATANLLDHFAGRRRRRVRRRRGATGEGGIPHRALQGRAEGSGHHGRRIRLREG